MRIEDLIPTGHENAVSRQYLRSMTGLNDRSLREAIKSSDELIINVQDGKGYFKPAEGEEPYIRRYIIQERSRSESTLAQVVKAQKYLRRKGYK